MSVELEDLRAKITAEAHCALVSYSRAHAIDKSELVRDILHAWALKQIHAANLLGNCLRAKGVTAAPQGTSGNPKELPWEDE